MDKQTKFRLGKLIGLLGSDQDGEALAAARAIGRELQAKGLSFGDLVALVQGADSQMAIGYESNGLEDMARSILQNENMMRARETVFVRDIMWRAANIRYFKMTEKQAKWFAFLYSRYGEA